MDYELMTYSRSQLCGLGVRIFDLIGRGRLEARGLTLEFEDLLFQVLYRLLLGWGFRGRDLKTRVEG